MAPETCAVPEDLSSLRSRLGGQWFGSWTMWLICMAFGLLLLASELLAAQSATLLVRWLLVWAITTTLSALIMMILHRTLLSRRYVSPLPIAGAIALSAGFGLFYSVTLWITSLSLQLTGIAPWPLRVIVITAIATWLIPVITVALATIAASRHQRHSDLQALVQLEIVRLKELSLVLELRSEVREEVSRALNPVRERLDIALSQLAESSPIDDSEIARSLRTSATASVRTLSHDLWNSAEAKYPRTPWERILVATVTTQPLRTWIIVICVILADGIFTTIRHGAAGLTYAVVTTVSIGLICTGANALMRIRPRWHALWFGIGVCGLVVLDVIASLSRRTVLGESVSSVTIVVAALVTILIVFVTSAFGTWTSEQDHVRGAFRADVDVNLIEELARSVELASIARDASLVLHGTVQTRLVACAMAIERSQDRSELVEALTQALDSLHNPLPERSRSANSVQSEVSRKVALWGDLCTFHITVDCRVEGRVDSFIVGRIVEEGVTNSIRHGAASTIDVSVDAVDSVAIIEISDDGVGPLKGRAGLGSALLQQACAGEWILTQSAGRTRLTAQLPLDVGSLSAAGKDS